MHIFPMSPKGRHKKAAELIAVGRTTDSSPPRLSPTAPSSRRRPTPGYRPRPAPCGRLPPGGCRRAAVVSPSPSPPPGRPSPCRRALHKRALATFPSGPASGLSAGGGRGGGGGLGGGTCWCQLSLRPHAPSRQRRRRGYAGWPPGRLGNFSGTGKSCAKPREVCVSVCVSVCVCVEGGRRWVRNLPPSLSLSLSPFPPGPGGTPEEREGEGGRGGGR